VRIPGPFFTKQTFESVSNADLPTTFTVEVVIADAGNRKIEIPVRIDQTLADFREAVRCHDGVTQSKIIFILVGHELVGESVSLKDLGFLPDSVIHAGKSPDIKFWFRS
jgi:hypothetical protein